MNLNYHESTAFHYFDELEEKWFFLKEKEKDH